MALHADDVEKVALLARLQLSPEELAEMTSQLDAIVGYIQQLAELDTDAVEPMAHAADLHNVFREDDPQPSIARDQALQNAPKRDDETYRVPAVLGD